MEKGDRDTTAPIAEGLRTDGISSHSLATVESKSEVRPEHKHHTQKYPNNMDDMSERMMMKINSASCYKLLSKKNLGQQACPVKA